MIARRWIAFSVLGAFVVASPVLAAMRDKDAYELPIRDKSGKASKDVKTAGYDLKDETNAAFWKKAGSGEEKNHTLGVRDTKAIGDLNTAESRRYLEAQLARYKDDGSKESSWTRDILALYL